MPPGLLVHHACHRPEAHGPHNKSCEGLHVDHKAIACDVARVCLAVLLPCSVAPQYQSAHLTSDRQTSTMLHAGRGEQYIARFAATTVFHRAHSCFY